MSEIPRKARKAFCNSAFVSVSIAFDRNDI